MITGLHAVILDRLSGCQFPVTVITFSPTWTLRRAFVDAVRIGVEPDIPYKITDVVSIIHGPDRLVLSQGLALAFTVGFVSFSFLGSSSLIDTDVIEMRELMDDGLHLLALHFVDEGEGAHLNHLRCLCWVYISKDVGAALRWITVPI